MHFKLPGNFKPILWNESIVLLWRKRHFFKTLTTAGEVSPRGVVFVAFVVLVVSCLLFFVVAAAAGVVVAAVFVVVVVVVAVVCFLFLLQFL